MNKTYTQPLFSKTTLHFSLLTLLTSIKQVKADCEAAYGFKLIHLCGYYVHKEKRLRRALKIITYALHRRLFIAGITQVPFTYLPHITKADIIAAVNYARRTH